MENPFKKLWQPHQEVPKEIKERVKNDIALYSLLGEFSSLVTYNYGDVVKSILKKYQPINNNKNGKAK